MTSSIHLTDAKGRDATVGLASVKAPPGPKLGLPDGAVSFRRFIAVGESQTHKALTQRFGADYAQQLVTGDPEIDFETVGSFIGETQLVFLDGDGQVMFVDPKVMEVVFNPDGTEKERREPVDSVGNVDEASPVRWTGRKIPLVDAVHRFAFKRRLQLRHVDGLTFDFLFQMARDLEASHSLMLLGTGEKASGPLVFQANGRPYRGFLQGRTRERSYQLVLLLSEMELKAPVRRASGVIHG